MVDRSEGCSVSHNGSLSKRATSTEDLPCCPVLEAFVYITRRLGGARQEVSCGSQEVSNRNRHSTGSAAGFRGAGDKSFGPWIEQAVRYCRASPRRFPRHRRRASIAPPDTCHLFCNTHLSLSTSYHHSRLYIAFRRLVCTYDLLIAFNLSRVTPIRAPWTLKTKGRKNCRPSRPSTPSYSSTQMTRSLPRYISLSNPRLLSLCAFRQRPHPPRRTRTMAISSRCRSRPISMGHTSSNTSHLST